MTQTPQGASLDLPDALTRQAEFLPDFFQRVAVPVLQPEAQAQNARFTRGQRIQQLFDFSLSNLLKALSEGLGSRSFSMKLPNSLSSVLAHWMLKAERAQDTLSIHCTLRGSHSITSAISSTEGLQPVSLL